MKVWAIADTHLSLATPDKKMDIFGEKWVDHHEKIKKHWLRKVNDNDLVLIAGDISWAKHHDEALADLEWIDQLPGKKVISKGNHDYWWPSNKQLKEMLPPSIQFVQKSALNIGPYSIAGTRLWDHRGVNFAPFIEYTINPKASHPQPKTDEELAHDEKIYQSELARLESALQGLNQDLIKICMVHYPPLNAQLEPTEATQLMEKYNVDLCIFGHLHNVKQDAKLFDATKNNIRYVLTSCDYLHFEPFLLLAE